MNDVSKHYKGERGLAYTEHHQSDSTHPGFALNLAYFEPYLSPDAVVLDFGCGNGGMLRLLRDRVARADGLEVNPAARRMAEEVPGARLYAHIGELPDHPVYDVVVSNHVLEHVRDVCGTLERIRHCIKPGGLFVTKLPIDDFRTKWQRRWSERGIDHHLHTWTPRLFANTLRESGYDVERCDVVTSAWHPRLFPFLKVGLGPLAFWAFAVIKRRRQVLAVGRKL